MKKGFTIIELIISIMIIGLILVAITSFIPMILRNYTENTIKSTFQSNLNFATDSIARDIKTATTIETTGGAYTKSSTTLILGLPSIDGDGNFLYDSSGFKKDLIIFTKDGDDLKKVVIPNASSARIESEKIILKNVSSVSFDYAYVNQVVATITLTKTAGRSISTTSSVRARMRNVQ